MSASVLARALRAYVRYAPGTEGKAHPVRTTVRLLSGDKVNVTTSDVIQRYQYLLGEWEPNLSAFLRGRRRPGNTFVDVGAHRGAFSLLASHAVGPHGRVVAIEPSPRFHDDLTTTNRRTNLRSVRSAAYEHHGTLPLYPQDPANLGHTTVVEPRHVHTVFEVQTALLADLVSRSELATTRIIGIDVEGAEAAASEGFCPRSHTFVTTLKSSWKSPQHS
ncbi:FkbM family methyltransferase [Streptomyces albidoflavus]